jgi:hypothetical protein
MMATSLVTCPKCRAVYERTELKLRADEKAISPAIVARLSSAGTSPVFLYSVRSKTPQKAPRSVSVPYNCLLFTRGRLGVSIALIRHIMEAAMQRKWITQRWPWLEGKPAHKMAILLLIALLVVCGFAAHLTLHQQHHLLTNEEVGLRQ